MSIESVLEDHTAALRDHAAALLAVAALLAKAVQSNQGVASVDAATCKTAPEALSTAPRVAATSFDEVKKCIVELSSTKGRDAAVAVLAEFGASRCPDLKPDQHAVFIARAQELTLVPCDGETDTPA